MSAGRRLTRANAAWLAVVIVSLVLAGCGDDEILLLPGDEPEPTVAVVRLVADADTYGIGETVSCQVIIENAADVGSVPFHMRYDPDVLRYASSEEGPFLGADGTETVFLVGEPVRADRVIVGLSRLGASHGASGSGVLATFEFVAVGAGDAGLSFTDASVRDPQAEPLPAAFSTQPVLVVD